jgi:TPR repeat protein/S1-C subfamily serine protease
MSINIKRREIFKSSFFDFWHYFLLLSFLLIFPAQIKAEKLFLKDEYTLKEKNKAKEEIKKLKDISKELKLIKLMFIYENFKKGNCEEFVKIEGKAKQGSSYHQWIMSDLYNLGLCVNKNAKQAFKWLQKSATQSHMEAMRDLGYYFYWGRGTEKNYKAAVHWFEKAAEAGESQSQLKLGEMYEKGEGVPQSYLSAKEWYQKSAELGNSEAALQLSDLMTSGDLGYKDFEGALNWNLPFAEQGHTVSQLVVAQMYLQKKESDSFALIQVHKWANLATQTNNKELRKLAIKIRSHAEKGLSSAELLRAQKLAKNWKASTNKEAVTKIIETDAPPTISEKTSDGLSPSQAKAKLAELGIPTTKDAYFQSVEEDNLGIFKLFHKAGVDLETKRIKPIGVTALYESIDFGSLKIYRYLMDNNANINVVNIKNGMTPLVRAIAHERWDIVDELIKKGADASQQPQSLPEQGGALISGTALNYALFMSNKTDLIEKLLNMGASVKERYSLNETPVFVATKKGSIESLKVLLKYEAEINPINLSGLTPLMDALAQDSPNYDVIDFLLANGADANFKTRSNQTPLYMTIAKGDSKLISTLLEFGADANESYNIPKKNIPFMIDDKLAIDVLKNGGSPLMLACAMEHASAVKVLMEAGSNLKMSFRGNLGTHTAMSIAKEKGNQAIINLLKRDVVERIQQSPEEKTHQASTGSGFFVSKMGHVITNAHVVKGCNRVTIGDNANKQVPAKVVHTDRRDDLALLKLSTLAITSAESKSLIQKLNIVAVPLASRGLLRSEDVMRGEKVLVAGFPFGDFISNTMKVTTGIVSATIGAGDDSGQFQLDAAIQPGNSGGPIYDYEGNIVGVVVSQLNKLRMAEAIGTIPENQNFGIKASTVRRFLESNGLPSKKAERTKDKSSEEVAQIAENQTLMVMCFQ